MPETAHVALAHPVVVQACQERLHAARARLRAQQVLLCRKPRTSHWHMLLSSEPVRNACMSRARLKAQQGLLSSNPARYACLSALIVRARQERLHALNPPQEHIGFSVQGPGAALLLP